MGFFIGDELAKFKETHKNMLTGEKKLSHDAPAFVAFENGKTAKFYSKPLREIVKLQGWSFEKL